MTCMSVISLPFLHIWVRSWLDTCVLSAAREGEVQSIVGGSSSIPKDATRASEPIPGGTHHMPPASGGTWATGSGQAIKAKQDVICCWPGSLQTEAVGCPEELRLLDQQIW